MGAWARYPAGGAAQRAQTAPMRARSPAAHAPARAISAIERGVLDHPSHELIERDARMRCELGHERRLGHAGLRVDLETDKSPSPFDALVVAEVRTAHAPAAQRAMRRQR